VSHVSEACEQYVDVLVAPSSVAPSSGAAEGKDDDGVARARWREELANRRQLASYLATMVDDLNEDAKELDAAVAGYRWARVRLRAYVVRARVYCGGVRSSPSTSCYCLFGGLVLGWPPWHFFPCACCGFPPCLLPYGGQDGAG
jgi:hypothetical protein